MFRRLLPLLALLATLLVVASPAHAARNFEVGLQDDPTFVYNAFRPGQTFAFSLVKGLRVSYLRINVAWAEAAGSKAGSKKRPKGTIYKWTKWDNAVSHARSKGLKVQLVLMGQAPAWATSNKKIGPVKPSGKEYGLFAGAAAKHFYARGVRRFSVWNEPNFIGWIQPKKSQASTYRSMYYYGYAAIHRSAPKAQILFGELAPFVDGKRFTSPLSFTRSVLCVDSKYRKRSKKKGCHAFRTNGVADHPYNYSHGPTYKGGSKDDVTIGTLSRLTKALDKFKKLGALKPVGAKSTPVYLTEFSYLAKATAHEKAWSETNRKTFIPQAFGIALKNPRVRQLVQYEIANPPCPGPWCFWESGLVSQNGVKLPSYHALQAWVNKNKSKLAK